MDATPDTWQWSARTSLGLRNSSALVAVAEGSELYYNYGEMCAEQFFLAYGFAPAHLERSGAEVRGEGRGVRRRVHCDRA